MKGEVGEEILCEMTTELHIFDVLCLRTCPLYFSKAA